eukprot:gnl/TRDRNA2_/TRDRNA2_198575_c0_seq1.p1 gnl/TRDRNA2_/TRDRNA2_198575_c0~~gnl/TRDRNA2_/TRDRNA2_198575_c0_seq1.p1  ORF type:complete len:346 (+),score=34.57 gnl/TRDRNA2_/TRDRNA2_198575_c0_seq1:140-1039(+)
MGVHYSVEQMADRFFHRTFRSSRSHRIALDNTALEKSGHLAVRPCPRNLCNRHCVGPLHYRSAVASSNVAPFRPTGPRFRHGSDVSCASCCEDHAQPHLTTDVPFGRRYAVLGGAVAVTGLMQPVPVVADEEFADGPDGIKYRDLTIGKGAEPSDGDKLAICDVPFSCGDLTVADGDLTATSTVDLTDPGKLFVFTVGGWVIPGFETAVIGGGKMPPMKVGGTRKVLIPPALGYGEDKVGLREGVGCNKGGKCTIPADSTLEYTIQLVSIKRGKSGTSSQSGKRDMTELRKLEQQLGSA